MTLNQRKVIMPRARGPQPNVTPEALAMLRKLTAMEQETLIGIAEGLSNKAMAERGVAVRTVETHRERIMHKLDLHSVAELTQFAYAVGLAENPYLAKPAAAQA